MKVTLLSYTRDAAELLLFTKNTRLTLSPGLMEEINAWSSDKKAEELAYMANTIPSSWEFVDYIFLAEGVSRAFTHQAVRTRNASYAQQTMRVLDMGGFDYVFTERNLEDHRAVSTIEWLNERTRDTYNYLISIGQLPEDARGVLPTNISTNIVCKYNLRTFTELVKSRTGGRTQDEYQQVVNAMADEVLKVHPWAEAFLFQQGRDYFADIEAFAKREFGDNPSKKGELLKIVDKMRQGLRQ